MYSILFWSHQLLIPSPSPHWQVIRVYIGSFWSHPLLIPDNRKLFEAEEQDLFKDIQSLPRNAALRKLNDLIKRARLAKVRYTGNKNAHPPSDGDFENDIANYSNLLSVNVIIDGYIKHCCISVTNIYLFYSRISLIPIPY